MNKLVAVSDFLKTQRRVKYALYIYAALVEMGGHENGVYQSDVLDYIENTLPEKITRSNMSHAIRDMKAAGILYVRYCSDEGELSDTPSGSLSQAMMFLSKDYGHFIV